MLLQQVQRQAEALAQDPPRPLNALRLFPSFDPNEQTSTFPTATTALPTWLPANLCAPASPADSFLFVSYLDRLLSRGIEMEP